MVNNNDFFMRMCKEAAEELASGEEGWKKVDTNTLFLACFGMLSNHLIHNLARPMWFFAASVAAGVIGYIIHLIFSG